MRRIWSAVTDRANYLRRAVRRAGSERGEVLLGAKTVIAAMAAWVLARYLLPPAVSTFAPFTALVALRATVYRSVLDCLQYVLAMAVGATLAATLAAVAGIHGWTFGLLTLLALCVGRIRRFGQQGIQVAIVGFFAFSSGQGQIDYIGHLIASVGIGALCGLTAHLVLAPACHTGHRQQAVTDLYTTMASASTTSPTPSKQTIPTGITCANGAATGTGCPPSASASATPSKPRSRTVA
ncbi:aromatic acid exporter family protein [Streptomyces sp. NPDC002138]|uniref:aromatic acid exporter family protein n=1 Tax=Streptomyces sp. NPDC002138 TaxID=3154410 RepID=UPI0033216315